MERSLQQVLANWADFATLSEGDRQWLESVGQAQTLPVRAVLIQEGEPIPALYILIEGRFGVSVSATQAEAGEQGWPHPKQAVQLGVLEPGQLAGEVSFVDDRPPLATVTALEPARVWAIPRCHLTPKLALDRRFSSHFYHFLAATLSRRLRSIADLLARTQELPSPPLPKALFMFGVLNDADIDWMVAIGELQRWNPGTVLIQAGEVPAAVYIVLSGSFAVSVSFEPESPEQEIAQLSSGEIVGEMSFVETATASATVVCRTSAQVLALPSSQLAAHLQQDYGFATRFYRAICVVVADRLREGLIKRGYSRLAFAEGQTLEDDLEYEDEIDLQTLEQTALARVRFDWMMKRLATKLK
uniref:Cyclic nucleotide-binding protein n=1 Tax=Cyanothece sp. (strain PCC 7425 / ATCC 29141) TaxID=395961 RepID=B8HRD4_CYAP4